MSYKHVASNALHCCRVGLASIALFQFAVGALWPVPLQIIRTTQSTYPARQSNTSS